MSEVRRVLRADKHVGMRLGSNKKTCRYRGCHNSNVSEFRFRGYIRGRKGLEKLDEHEEMRSGSDKKTPRYRGCRSVNERAKREKTATKTGNKGMANERRRAI